VNSPRTPVSIAALVSLLVLFACRPVFAIGWEEIIVIGLFFVFLLGPLLFRLARAWIKFQESTKKDRD
jgi:hypothetical protein